MSAHKILHEMFQSPFLIADPGASKTIHVERWGAVAPIVTAGAEARTLAAPSKAGMLCMVALDVRVGDLTLTVTGGYNQAGATTIVLNTAGDWVALYSVKIGANYRWRIMSSEGVDIGNPDAGLVSRQGGPEELAEGNATLTIAMLLKRIVQQTPTGDRTLTLPTGELVDAGVKMSIGDSFDWTVLNAAANTHSLTVAAAATGHTVVGGMVVAAASSGLFRTRKTAADTFVTYRIA